jgi:hypothetical protein
MLGEICNVPPESEASCKREDCRGATEAAPGNWQAFLQNEYVPDTPRRQKYDVHKDNLWSKDREQSHRIKALSNPQLQCGKGQHVDQYHCQKAGERFVPRWVLCHMSMANQQACDGQQARRKDRAAQGLLDARIF